MKRKQIIKALTTTIAVCMLSAASVFAADTKMEPTAVPFSDVELSAEEGMTGESQDADNITPEMSGETEDAAKSEQDNTDAMIPEDDSTGNDSEHNIESVPEVLENGGISQEEPSSEQATETTQQLEIVENEIPVLRAAPANGWYKENNIWYYYENGNKVTGWKKISNKWYYMDASGVMKTGWVKTKGYWYYLNASGAMQYGWLQDGKNKYWLGDNPDSGAMRIGWQKVDNKWYWFGTNKDSGTMRRNWQKIDGKWYWFSAETDAYMRTGWQTIGNKTYWLGESANSGYMRVKWQKIDNRWYWFGTSADSGYRRSGWQNVDNKRYWFGSEDSGYMRANWQKIDNQWYWLGTNTNDGYVRTGWQIINNKTYWFGNDVNNAYMRTKWQKLNNNWYWFGGTADSGYMRTGWYKANDNKWYYSNNNGIMSSSTWVGSYYVGASGAMYENKWAKGETIGKRSGKWYYFKTGGKLAGQNGVGEWVGGVGVGNYYIDKTGYMFTVNNGGYPQKSLSNGFGKDENGRTQGYIFTFDPNSGKCIAQRSRFIDRIDPVTGRNVHLEEQFATDPQIGKDITQEDFLTAVLYTESGDQGKAGMMMVGYVIMNRLASSSYPGTLQYLIYQENYFEVTRDGSLTKVLTDLKNGVTNRYYENARAAAKAVLAGEDIKTEDGTLIMEKSAFHYMYFMTPSSFRDLGLSESRCQCYTYNGHVYFRYYIEA